MTVDPDARAVVNRIRAQRAATLSQPPLAQLRQDNEQVRLLSGEGPDVRVQKLDAVVDGRMPVPVWLHRPHETAGALPVVLLLHSGWFTMGSAATVDGVARSLADQAPALVVSVDYRLAPEHPFPAGLDDAETALRWALAHADRYGGDPGRTLAVGESAGGALAAGLALRARDAGLPLAGQVLVYPNASSGLDTPSWDAYDGWVVDRASGRAFLDGYAPGDAAYDPQAFPLLADHRGVAPAAVLTMEHDPIRDEGEALADRLDRAGALAHRRRFPGLIHGALLMLGAVPAARAVLDDVVAQLKVLPDAVRAPTGSTQAPSE